LAQFAIKCTDLKILRFVALVTASRDICKSAGNEP